MALLDPPLRPGLAVTRLRGYPLRLEYDRGSYLGRFLEYRGMYEEALIKTMFRELRPGGCMVDVGANIGLHTVVAAHRVGPEGRVLALEPQRRIHDRLLTNIALNELRNVVVRRVAASTREGELVLHQPNAGNDGQATLALSAGERSAGAESIRAESLDRILDEAVPDRRPEMMKLDVEGAELDVLRSAPRLFATQPPRYLFIECIERHLNRFDATSGTLMDWLARAGYRLRALRAGRWVPVSPADGLNLDLLASR